MISKKKIISGLAVLMMLASTLSATVPAYAATDTNNGTNFFTGFVQFIAQKFGLDQNQVKSAVTDYKNSQKQNLGKNMQTREKARLDKLVSQEKITGAQKHAIIDELAALRTKYSPENFKNLTPDQRKQQFQNEQNDVNTWAKAQGIDPKYLMPFGAGMRGGFHGKGFVRGWGR